MGIRRVWFVVLVVAVAAALLPAVAPDGCGGFEVLAVGCGALGVLLALCLPLAVVALWGFLRPRAGEAAAGVPAGLCFGGRSPPPPLHPRPAPTPVPLRL